MISTVYSETGGVIERNFLDAGTFSRFPSIFASADRYSGVAMMQIYLTFLLLFGNKPPNRKILPWLALCLIAGVGSLLISGARSRIIMISAALFAAGIAFSIAIARRRLTGRKTSIAWGVFLIPAIVIAAGLIAPSLRESVTSLPVLAMLGETIDTGDVGQRLAESIELSGLPDNVTFLGEGLGVTGAGRPGEFGIQAMWIESGLFWTPIMLLIHIGILFCLGRVALRAALHGHPLLTFLVIGQVLAWLFALLAGLSSTFELSQALLLFPTIAVCSMITLGRPPKLRRRVPMTIRPGAQMP
jgi:hypothetical protein